MMDELKRNYREWKGSPPGKRFQELHQRRARRGGAHKSLRVVLSVALIGVGLALLVLPGPGVVFLVLGFGLVAQEFSSVARGLDRLELRLRR